MIYTTDGSGNSRVYPTLSSSYVWDFREEEKCKRDMLRVIKKRKLPKSLEVSLIKSLLEDVENMPEHEYSKKYDTFHSLHSFKN